MGRSTSPRQISRGSLACLYCITEASITLIKPVGGVLDNPEEVIRQVSSTQVVFNTHTSGDSDGGHIFFEDISLLSSINVTGSLRGHVKVGNSLAGNPHKAQPEFRSIASIEEATVSGGMQLLVKGGADLFVSTEIVSDVSLPKRVEGQFSVNSETRQEGSLAGSTVAEKSSLVRCSSRTKPRYYIYKDLSAF
ncbi:hypothetical protein F5Y03DRAFT_96127 [Xylaria venustula]|nr:hypothetical protein F5Y03DRAFT_96127 [Xylaria venustula]